MTTITLPEDLEARLAEEARRRGTTVEELAVGRLRSSLSKVSRNKPTKIAEARTMYDVLKPYIGVLEGGPVDLSQDTSSKYAESLEEDYRRQQEEFLLRNRSK